MTVFFKGVTTTKQLYGDIASRGDPFTNCLFSITNRSPLNFTQSTRLHFFFFLVRNNKCKNNEVVEGADP